jgi:hypothetical protein
VIFSAGSLTSSLYLDLQGRARNQFYIVEFDTDAAANLGLGVAATFSSWDWATGIGWQPAQPGSAIPATGGFGYRINVSELAGLIKRNLEAARTPQSFAELLATTPSIKYLIPADVALVRQALEDMGVRVSGLAGTIDQAAIV